MISHLHIRDLGIIEEIYVELDKGLNVLTGETGAGKSLIINALCMILGNKISKSTIRKGATKASVEALFYIEDEYIKNELAKFDIDASDELVISRELSDNSRSLVKINGKIVSMAELKEVSGMLIDLHGQYDSQSLLNVKKHIELLDDIALKDNKKLIKEYIELYEAREELKRKCLSFGTDISEREKRLEFLKFQIDEIEKANLQINEDTILDEKRKAMLNSEKIIKTLSAVNMALSEDDTNVCNMLQNVIRSLETISEYNKDYSGYVEKISEAYYNLEEISRDLSSNADRMELNLDELNSVEERLDSIIKLKRKYGNTIEEVLQNYEKMCFEYKELVDSEELIQKLEAEIKLIEDKMYSKAKDLSEIRVKKSKNIEEMIMKILADLEMPNTNFKVSIEFDENRGFTRNGLDKVEFLFSSNYGEELKPLSAIASGGETSRIMLAIKSTLASADKVPTMVFDEIDTGLSGKAGFAVADKLVGLAKDKQVICITHLPSIAAKGNNNLFVSKGINDDRTVTNIKRLDENEVINEIARITSGGNITDIALKHARELRQGN